MRKTQLLIQKFIRNTFWGNEKEESSPVITGRTSKITEGCYVVM